MLKPQFFIEREAEDSELAQIYIKRSDSLKKKEKNGFWDNLPYWVSYYRDNPHRFVIEYMGIYLHWWQQIVIYDMWFTYNTLFLASRGSGKTFLTMVYCLAKCLLYPGIIIRVAAANKKQAGLLLAKVKEIERDCPMVKREIGNVSIGKDESKITFKEGGSEIATVVAGPGARGERCQVLIVDEREIVDKEVIGEVFTPFLTAVRNRPFLRKKEYRHLADIETNNFIQLSSIGSTSSSMYDEFKQYLKFMRKGIQDYCVYSIPYQIPFSTGVINKKILQKMIRENTTSLEKFKKEMEVIPSGEGESPAFNFEYVNRSRKLQLPILPITDDEYIKYKGKLNKCPFYKMKEHDELRVLVMDVALMSTTTGSENDLSAFKLWSLKQVGDYFIKTIPYIETIDGANIDPQVLRLKQLYFDLECDYIVLDCGGIGETILDLCTKPTEDVVRDKIYPAIKVLDDYDSDKRNARVLDENAEPVIYPIKVAGASARKVHSNMLTKARLNFERGRIRMLTSEDNIEIDILEEFQIPYFNQMKMEERLELYKRVLKPYMETTFLKNEATQTEVKDHVGGGISFDEGSGRKDRLMALIYGSFFVDILEQDIENLDDDDDDDLVLY